MNSGEVYLQRHFDAQVRGTKAYMYQNIGWIRIDLLEP